MLQEIAQVVLDAEITRVEVLRWIKANRFFLGLLLLI